MATSIIIAMICVAIWAYLIGARGMYWRASVRDATSVAGVPGPWPAVAAVIPARNESECIARSVTVAAAAGLSRATHHRGRR